jgi:hypothetical protein
VRRPLLAFVLSFLLLGLQQEVAVHTLWHLDLGHGPKATVPHEGQPCAECLLLASGADSVATSPASPDAACASAPVAPVAFITRAVAAPACYSPRAPPVLR